ncbi:MAG: T9SS type A sorting domain-containing protein [Saprospiraceae bacterium]
MSGTYDVIITDAAGCEYHYGGFVIDNLSAAKEPVWLGGVSLQLNPTSGITDVIFAPPVNSRLELSLIDATGRVLKTQITEQATVISIDCSNLPGGVYSLRFRSNHEVGSRKLMVIR